MKLFSLIFLFFSLLNANEADTIIKKLEENLRGEDIYTKMEIEVKTARHTRTMLLESWGEGKKKNFTKILEPSRDRGITFLNLDKQMWQYVPKIERIIKIPPSMMLQSWMGTDFTNDDMVKQSSYVDDYNVKLLERKGSVVTLQLTPKSSAAVVWGKIVSKIDTQHFTQLEDQFYDDDGKKVRTITYDGLKQFGSHYTMTKMVIIPLDTSKKGNRTTITMHEVVYDQGVDPSYFSKSALKRYSR